jgi:hypothetical protein
VTAPVEVRAILDALVQEAAARLDRRQRRVERYAARGANLLFVRREVDVAQRNLERVEALRTHVLELQAGGAA